MGFLAFSLSFTSLANIGLTPADQSGQERQCVWGVLSL